MFGAENSSSHASGSTALIVEGLH